MADATPYTLEIDLNVLNHLGLNLYSNVPAVLSELIANAWDADADSVCIVVSDKGNQQKEIEIRDNGVGMNQDDLNQKFLKVGYQRRTDSAHDLTLINKRKIMGRKGIGKLSVFSISEHVQIFTRRKDGENLGLELTLDGIRQSIENKQPYHPKEICPDDSLVIKENGTTIILKQLKRRVNASLDSNLRKRVARRFDIVGNGFEVRVNGKPITIEDRDYFHKLEYACAYGGFDKGKLSQISDENIEERPSTIKLHNQETSVIGWIGLAKESGALQDGADNLNKISVLARGKVALEDILESFREGGLYTKYVIGEIRADFLDDTQDEDISTSSRQNFVQSDGRFIALREFIEGELKHISNKRVDIKTREGEKKAIEIPAVKEWYSSLQRDAKKAAKKLFGRINQIATDEKNRKILYKHGVLAFEHLRHKEMVNELDNLNIENLEATVKLFSELDDIEATWYYQITEGRLDVIRKLSEDITNNTLEKIIQKHIYTHLWLLDPSWDRATETPTLEQSVSTSFAKISNKLTAKEKKGRIDIRYKKTSGKHVIIELKRGSVITETGELMIQIDNYISALQKQLQEADDRGSIEAICVVGKNLRDWDDLDRRQQSENSLEAKNIRVITYQQLIKDAESSYRLYLEKKKEKGRIKKILDEIEES